MAFGDSITAGEVTVPVGSASASPRSETLVVVSSASYPSVLADMLHEAYPSQAATIRVVNEGKPAEAAAAALPRFIDAFEAHNPEVVLLMEGYNDVCCGSGMSTGRTAAALVGNLAAEARRRGALVFVATLAPSKPGFRAALPEAIDGFNQTIPSFMSSGQDTLVDVFSWLQPELDLNIGIDGLHPTEVGYKRIARAFFAAIRTRLEAPR
jgi:lysophospholipase L1-like esterase